MFRNYLTVAWRHILNSKAHSSINILGLGLGLACPILILLYISDDLSFDKFHINAGNIYRVGGNAISPTGEVEWQTGRSSLLAGPHFAQTVPEIEQYVRIEDNWFDIRVGDEMVSQKIFSADKNFFSFFSFELIRGDSKTALSDPHNIVPVAWYLADRWLSEYPYRFDINWVMFAEVGSIVIGVALMTTVWQSLRAALHNPVHSLKE